MDVTNQYISMRIDDYFISKDRFIIHKLHDTLRRVFLYHVIIYDVDGFPIGGEESLHYVCISWFYIVKDLDSAGVVFKIHHNSGRS